MAGFNFGDVLEGNQTYIPTGYRSHESGQIEMSGYLAHSSTQGYETIYTVGTGKTFYITDLIFGYNSSLSPNIKLATGAAASEVDFLGVSFQADVNGDQVQPTIHIKLSVPFRITTGTRISVTMNATTTFTTTILGFEE